MTKVLLINPPGTEFTGTGNTTPPLGLLYLISELEQQSDIAPKFIDGCITGKKSVLDLVKKWKPDVVGLPTLTPCRHSAFDLIFEIKKISNCKIVVGGAHATALPEQVMENYPVDAVCKGEGEKWLLNYVNTGESFDKLNQQRYENLDDIPFPAWHLLNFKSYDWKTRKEFGQRAHVVFSRGCPYHCNFCSTWWIWGSYRWRSAKNMVEELKLLILNHNVNHFTFVDDAMTINKEPIMELCEEILKEGLDIKWLSTTRVDCVDYELLEMMRDAGCYKISYGVESGAPEIIKNVHKGARPGHKGLSPEEYPGVAEKAIRMTQELGMSANCLMMIGNPEETDETIEQSLAFLYKTKPKSVGCTGGVWLLPKTALYNKAKREGIIDDSFWLGRKPMMFWPFSPKQLTKWHRRLLSYSRYFWWRHRIAEYYPRATIGRFMRKFYLFRKYGFRVPESQLTRSQIS